MTACTHEESLCVLEVPFFIEEACLKGFSKGHFLNIYCYCPSALDPWLSVFAVRREEWNLGALSSTTEICLLYGHLLLLSIHGRSLIDALLGPGVNPLEGSPMWSCGKLGPKVTRSLVPGWTHLRVHQMSSCGKLGPRARSRLPTLERGRGSSWEPQD
jgi:hypothetical protein